jgi:hypothetical protein
MGEGDFRVMIRQSTINVLDFSVILGFRRPRETRWFRLRRYNGQHPGEHRNKLERERDRKSWQRLRGCHIHLATARYQERGFEEDAYAVPTEKYTSVDGAIELLMDECGFEKPVQEPPNPSQGSFWPER